MVRVTLFPMLNLLYFYISTFRSVCAVPNMAVLCSFDFVLSLYVAQVFSEWFLDSSSCPYYCWYHIWFYVQHVLYFYCKVFILRIFLVSFLITFLSPKIATYINIHVPFSLSLIMMSCLSLGMVLSVCACRFHNMVTLPFWLVSTDFGTCSYQCFLSDDDDNNNNNIFSSFAGLLFASPILQSVMDSQTSRQLCHLRHF